MKPDEGDLRMALDARSGETSPEFRSRMAALPYGERPMPTALSAIAVVSVAALTIATIGVLLFARNAFAPQRSGPASAARVTSPTPTALPSTTPIAMPNIAQLSPATNSVVWAYVGTSALFRSTDRGQTWQQRSLPVTQPGLWPQISFVDALRGWYSESGSPETQCNAGGVRIWRTTDGAATWQQIASVTSPPTGSNGISASQCKEGLSFIDATHGFLAGWDDNNPPTIYRTADGGQTWKDSTLPDPPGFVTQTGGFSLRAGLVQSFGSTLLLPAWGMNAGSQQDELYVFASTDGGATWHYQAKVPNQALTVAFVTASRWLQLIEPGQSTETTDSGKSWHSFPTDYSQAAPIAPVVSFGEPLVGYATVRGSIQRTTDGGAHWVMINTPGTQQPG